MKLGFVNERRGLGSDGGWAETGDRYLLKLLRDALFHTEDERGAPVVSYAHVVRRPPPPPHPLAAASVRLLAPAPPPLNPPASPRLASPPSLHR